MSSSAPDFSAAFDMVDDELAEADKRLREKRKRQQLDSKKPVKETSRNQISSQADISQSQHTSQSKESPKIRKKSPPKIDSELLVKKREVRRIISLKVLDENELKFNQLFHKLQLRGDVRKKQDLADEALGLLFGKYKQIL